MKTTQQVTEVTQICIFPYKLNNVRKRIDKKEWGKSSISDTSVTKARRYVASIPGAVAGESGHNQTFTVAIKLVHGFALGETDARTILSEYNNRCSPPWTERELTHKLVSALKQTNHTKPKGHLLGVPTGKPPAPRTPPRVLGVISCPVVVAPLPSSKIIEPDSQQADPHDKPLECSPPSNEDEEDVSVYDRMNLWKQDRGIHFTPELYEAIRFDNSKRIPPKPEIPYPSHLPKNPIRHLINKEDVEHQSAQGVDAVHGPYSSKEQIIANKPNPAE